MRPLAVLDETLFEFADIEVTLAGVIGAASALVLAVLVSALIRRALSRYSQRHDNAHQATFYTLSRVITYVLVAVAVIVALGFLDVPLSRFALIGGAIGVGLGFGLQNIFSNFVSGLILLFDKSLKVGDFVELESGVEGLVRDIKIRATTVVTNDNIDILVPNSEFVNGRVNNWTHREVDRRLRIPFGVAYGTDKLRVRAAALEAAEAVPFTRAQEGPRRPQVWLTGFGADALEYELVVWLTDDAVRRPAAVTAAYNWELHSALERYHLEIPFPQRDINLRGLFGLQDADALTALDLSGERDDRPASTDPASGPGAGTGTAEREQNDAIADVEAEPIEMEPDPPSARS